MKSPIRPFAALGQAHRPVHRSILAFLVLLALPGHLLAEEHEILGIDNRGADFMFFEPDFLRVAPGDRVTFVVAHFEHKPQSVFIPEGAAHWQVENGASLTVTLEQEGVYLFDCFYHNVMGMAGVIVVGEPENLDAATRFFADYRQRTFAMNKDRLDHVWDARDGLLVRAAREAGDPP